MGATYVTVTVSNPAEPERAWKGEFLVDTGALNSVVPRERLQAVGIRPHGARRFELADGRMVDFDVGGASFEFLGQHTPAYVVFGEDGTEPLLGLTAMEALGVQVDPANERLTLLPPLNASSHCDRLGFAPDNAGEAPLEPDPTSDRPRVGPNHASRHPVSPPPPGQIARLWGSELLHSLTRSARPGEGIPLGCWRSVATNLVATLMSGKRHETS